MAALSGCQTRTDSVAAEEKGKRLEALLEETECSDGGEESAVPIEKDNEAQDDVAAVCEAVRAIDFNVEQPPHMELTEEEDRAYKEAFLRLLKNE